MKNADHVLVFDLDGTLVDSAVQMAAVLSELRSERGEPSVAADACRRWIAHGAEVMLSETLQLTRAAARSCIPVFRERYTHHLTPASAVYPGVEVALAALHGEGFAMAICSNKPQGLCEQVLRDTGLAQYFVAVVGGADGLPAKPDAAPLLKAVAACRGALDAALMVGDSALDLRAAQAAGLPFLWFSGGYDTGIDARLPCATFADWHDGWPRAVARGLQAIRERA